MSVTLIRETEAPANVATVADLLARLGGISPERVRAVPPPGTATEADVVEIERREGRLFELVDGTLVEKVMSYRESILAVAISAWLRAHVKPRRLGIVTGEAGMVRLFAGLIRIPDVAYVSWERIPGRRVPKEPVPALAPDLAVEVLSEGNTPAEMERKREEYFACGVRLVWLIDPRTRSAVAHSPGKEPLFLQEQDCLEGGEVLPGFALPLTELFAELDESGDEPA